MSPTTLTGQKARDLIESQLDQHAGGILKALAPFEPIAAVDAWLKTLRAVEELINLPGELDDDVLKRALLTLSLSAGTISPRRRKFVLHHLGYLHGTDFAQRQTTLLPQLSAMQRSFAMHGMLPAAIGLSTVANAIGYLQSRRRHLVSLLYLMPATCKGTAPITVLDALTRMLPQAEVSGTTVTGLLQQRAVSELHDDFAVSLHPHGFTASHSYDTLDGMFLEAERVPIIEIASAAQPNELEPLRPDRVFSASELRNNIALTEAAFSEFALDKTAFAGLAALVRELSYLVEDDFWVTLSPAELNTLADRHGVSILHRQSLTASGTTFVSALNSYAAFVPVGSELRGNVTLLSRFLYNFKNVCLYGKRRFQIRSGFIFEQRIKDELTQQGFTVQPIKRIDRKEFDVIATRDGVIFNVQCKNNLVDSSWIDLDPVRFIRTNRTLERYYERAIAKERSREQLLRDHLGLDRVEPFVITRFPIVTTNPRILPLARIQEFSVTAETVMEYEPADGYPHTLEDHRLGHCRRTALKNDQPPTSKTRFAVGRLDHFEWQLLGSACDNSGGRKAAQSGHAWLHQQLFENGDAFKEMVHPERAQFKNLPVWQSRLK
ncbi:hypothetical protein NKH54_24095 [Mesorhizobium sp. M1004]|uniref:hypothetical protein n=1 Tax=Mesorhizobium sp. M1004 TaxID=2957046 RepID=UPI003337A0A1